MVHWHFGVDACGEGNIQGIFNRRLKPKKEKDKKREEAQKGRWRPAMECLGQIRETVQDFHYL